MPHERHNESVTDRVGDTVRRGEQLAVEGNSGKSTGYHLDLRLLEEIEDDRRTNTDEKRFNEVLQRSFGATSYGDAGAARPQKMRVTVVHQGLENIRVEGLEPKAAERFRGALRGMTSVLSDALTEVSIPSNHHGFG